MTDLPADLSVVIVTPSDFAQVRRSVRHVREQAIAGRIELVLVATTERATTDADPPELEGFAAVQVVAVGPIPNVDKAAAAGILAASAEVVAVIEDHGYVQPGWAEALLAAYADGPWVSVGSVMGNANPARGQSWANLLLGYGWWIDPAQAGEMDDVPSHNGSYRREAVARFGAELPARMGRDGDLHDRLRAEGGRMLLAADAAITHANPSRLSATAELRFQAGRLYGAQRVGDEAMSTAKRLVYAVLFPLIALVRLRRLWPEHLAPGRGHAHLVPRVLPGLVLALVLDAAGQAAGYLRGPGRSVEILSTFEMDRIQHLSAADRRLLREPAPLL